MPPQHRNDPARQVRLKRLTWGVSVLLVGITFGAGQETLLARSSEAVWWYAIFGAAAFATVWRSFPVQLGRKKLNVEMSEIPTAFALIYLAPLAAAILVAAASVATSRFSDKGESHKLAFNGAIAFIRFVIAAIIFDQASTGPLRYLWLVSSLVIATAASDVITIAFVGFVTGQRTTFGQVAELIAVASVAASVAVLSVIAVQTHPLLGVLPTAVVLVLWAFIRQQQVDRQIHRDLTEAHRFSTEIGKIDPRSVLSVGLANIAEIMNADWVSAQLEGTQYRFGEVGNGPRLRVELSDRNTLEAGSTSGFAATATEQLSSIGYLFDNARRRADLTVQIEHGALHDKLTGLLSQQGFARSVDTTLEHVTSGTMMMFDLSRFSQVNDTLGFAAGDRLLKEVGQRLGEVAAKPGDSATAARLGGDSFGVFVPGENRTAALDMAAAIRTTLTEAILVDGVSISVGARVGIAYAPKHGETADELVRACGVAARQARNVEPPVVVYRADTDVHTQARLEMVYHLQAAVAAGDLDVYYQPKVDAISSRVIGAEALIRWPQEDGSFIPPNDFIPAAEAAGMINQITDFVLNRALSDLKTWPTHGGHLGVAVNLSPTTLLNPDTPAHVAGMLARHDVEPGRLTIEITESVMVSDTNAVATVLEALRKVGVRLSIDDFGTGYSSLQYLKDLEIDELKLDRAFVADLEISERSVTIARTVTGLGHSLGLQVVAEGVETPEAVELLNGMNVDIIQGFFVARPMPTDKFIRWQRTHPTYDLQPRRQSEAG